MRPAQSRDEELDQSARVVAGVAVRADAEVPDAAHELVGPQADFHGTYVQLAGAFGNPKPVQRPHPPVLIGGRSAPTLRVVTEHADLWNIPGGDIDDAVRRSALLDRYCAEIGRDPASITRSAHLAVSSAPYPADVARWVADKVITA